MTMVVAAGLLHILSKHIFVTQDGELGEDMPVTFVIMVRLTCERALYRLHFRVADIRAKRVSVCLRRRLERREELWPSRHGVDPGPLCGFIGDKGRSDLSRR